MDEVHEPTSVEEGPTSVKEGPTSVERLQDILPQEYSYKAMSLEDGGRFHFRVKLSTSREWLEFLTKFQRISKMNWSVKRTYGHLERFAYRHDYSCHHTNRQRDGSKEKKWPERCDKNTKCPAMMSVKIKLVTRNTKLKDKLVADGYPCIVTCRLIHNHALQSAASLRFLPEKTRSDFERYFEEGLTGAKAIHLHNHKVQLTSGSTTPDSSVNPRPRTVYYLWKKWRITHDGGGRKRGANGSNTMKVFVTRTVPDESLEILRKHYTVDVYDSTDPIPQPTFLERVKGCSAIFCMLTDKITESVLNAAGPQLRVVSTMSVGCDHLDLNSLRKRKIRIGYTPDVLTNSTAELAVALLFAVTRRIVEATEAVKSGEWTSWKPLWMCGVTLEGSTVGIVGLGRIGQRILEMLQPFRVEEFLYSGRGGSGEKEGVCELSARRVEFETLLKGSDIVIVTCALTDGTRGLIDSSAFSLMKPSAILINVSRGEVVQQDDLYQALTCGQIGAAGLDVTTPEPLPPQHPLLTLNNVVILPHIGSATMKARTDMALLTAENVHAALQGEPMPKEYQG